MHKKFKLLIVATSALIISFGCLAAIDNYKAIRADQQHIRELQIQREQLHQQTVELEKKAQDLEKVNEDTQKQIDAHKKTEEDLKRQIQELSAAKAERQRLAALAASPKAFAETPHSTPGACGEWMAAAGIPATYATNKLIINESGCNPNAVNPDSGACGIPQALPCSKIAHCGTEPVCQLRWMDSYVKGRYITWEAALDAWNARYPHWY